MLSICCWVLNLEFLTWGQLIFEIIQCMLRLCVMAQNSSRKMPCFGWLSRVVQIRIHRKERFPTGWKWMLNKFSLNNKERLHFDLIVSGEIVEFLGKINTVWNKFSLLCSNKLVAPWCMLRRQSDSSQRDIQSHWQIQLNLQSHCPQSEFQKAWKELNPSQPNSVEPGFNECQLICHWQGESHVVYGIPWRALAHKETSCED